MKSPISLNNLEPSITWKKAQFFLSFLSSNNAFVNCALTIYPLQPWYECALSVLIGWYLIYRQTFDIYLNEWTIMDELY
jgi:hypothetical protein